MDQQNEFPRRIILDQNTPAEMAIRIAIDEVEKLPPDEKLTAAVVLLSQAKDLVSDFVDEFLKSGI